MLSYFTLLVQHTIELSLRFTRNGEGKNFLGKFRSGRKMQKSSYRMYVNICETCSLYSQPGLSVFYNKGKCKENSDHTNNGIIYHHCCSNCLKEFIYLGFYVAFNTVQVLSRWVVGRAEETSTYSSSGFCTVNC